MEMDLLNKTLNLSISDDEENIRPPRMKNRRLRIMSTSEGSEAEINAVIQDLQATSSSKWTDPKGNQRNIIPFTECCGMPVSIRTSMIDKSPADFYALLVTDSLLQEIVEYTNAFAITKITNIFFSLILYMGLVKLRKLADYWSTDEIIGQNFPRSVMSRNRFELLLQMIHFSQDDDSNKSDRLHRVQHLMDMLNVNFKNNFIPGQDICVDESMDPFRGRLPFRQYNKQKRHKYGIKLFKLCTPPGHTFKINIYADKQNEEVNVTPQRVVMNLCQDLLNKGYSLYTDNWYTSVSLARELLENETHLIRTLRKNRKHFSKVDVSTKLKKGHFIAKESEDGITVLRWKDKRDVLVLSTKHSTRFVSGTKNNKTTMNPAIVVDYNKAKGAVDLVDQMAAYQTPLRKVPKMSTFGPNDKKKARSSEKSRTFFEGRLVSVLFESFLEEDISMILQNGDDSEDGFDFDDDSLTDPDFSPELETFEDHTSTLDIDVDSIIETLENNHESSVPSKH
ncbi:PiggyBac transposable element-derived protein 4 [Eumeta japonica]|uniref:PiggyBac transposable element-derived protein 4 n=1 Tax=Eumeta variegata TaxID=151549 RepID=A0A4C1UB83_EUMVA|nr:PiggyBac transposable element-derived protein 4 [Eumeta japonica]